MTHILTLVAPPGLLDAGMIEAAARAVQATAIRVLSRGEAVEMACTGPVMTDVRTALGNAPVDLAITPAENRRKRLLVADMDSTIVTGETLDELAVFAGVGNEVAAITARSMAGELDFAAALRERVALLRGLPLAALERTWAGVRLTPGARTLVQTMRAHGATTALVSGGFTWFTARVAAECGFDVHRANILLDDGTTLTGQVADPVLDRDTKLAVLHELAAASGLGPHDALAVGDGANDLAMIAAAGLGVAFHAKPVVAKAARVSIARTDLRSLLFLQGYTAGDFVL